jgi:hypothetical protein
LNFSGETFAKWAREKVSFLLQLKPIEYTVIGISSLSAVFGFMQIIMYIKYRFWTNETSDEIEMTEQNTNLLGRHDQRRVRITDPRGGRSTSH